MSLWPSREDVINHIDVYTHKRGGDLSLKSKYVAMCDASTPEERKEQLFVLLSDTQSGYRKILEQDVPLGDIRLPFVKHQSNASFILKYILDRESIALFSDGKRIGIGLFPGKLDIVLDFFSFAQAFQSLFGKKNTLPSIDFKDNCWSILNTSLDLGAVGRYAPFSNSFDCLPLGRQIGLWTNTFDFDLAVSLVFALCEASLESG